MPRKSVQVQGPRATLRVPDVLLALANNVKGRSLSELSIELDVPKTSLHRLLRTLVQGGYLTHRAGVYLLGPAAFHLATLIGKASPASALPACARPVMEWLAEETGETVMLASLADAASNAVSEVIYVDVIDSTAPVRFTVPVGDRRPFYSAASGKAVLGYLPPQAQKAYLNRTRFKKFTAFTTGRSALARQLSDLRENGVAFDRNGKVVGASALASPLFGRDGKVIASVSVGGPTERIESNRARYELLVRKAGERISRVLGFRLRYPPQLAASR